MSSARIMEVYCNHWPEAHVVFQCGKYYGATWCKCQKIRVVRGRHRASVPQAEADGRTLTRLAQAHISRRQHEQSARGRLEAQGPGR